MSQDNARQAGLTDQAIVELARRHNIHTVDGWNIFVHERHAGHDAVVQFAHAVIADFLDRAGQYVTNDASREAAIADALAAQSADASNAEAERFFQDHGLWHDRVTGQHMYTQDQYDQLRREAFHNGYASRNEEIELANHKGTCVDSECPRLQG
ncbi:hypothetical protein [Cupriavidus sp. EM10]|uniref:hypothetical protein n=1 Tax=Cupriavidus sp. EM10 TaxID=2839983 RepID=UPI001C0040DE|nr:hypothetical protein [Cupriavidus sp. EM10]QWE95623.1 hypothetical protein KLP38_07225 [Cupriavidus sp. EM10]